MRSWNGWEVLATHIPPQHGGSGTVGHRGRWVMWEMPLRPRLIHPWLQGMQELQAGRQGWSLLLLGKHLSIIVCGWESGGGEQRCSLAERSFPPAGPGSSLRLSCSRGWIIPAWHTGFFYFPNEKARLDLKHL